MNQLAITVTQGPWLALAAHFPETPFFEVGQELEVNGELCVVRSWDLDARKLVVSFDCWDANGGPVPW